MAQKSTKKPVANSKAQGGSKSFSAKQYVQPGLSEEEVLEIKEAFDLFDTDETNSIDPKEIKQAMVSLGFDSKNQTIYQMVSDLDADGNGSIDFEEFLKLMTTRLSDKDSLEDLKKVFYLFDDEKTNFINIQNLRRVAKELGETMDDNELQEMIDRADTDNDGFVSFDDFYSILTKKSLI